MAARRNLFPVWPHRYCAVRRRVDFHARIRLRALRVALHRRATCARCAHQSRARRPPVRQRLVSLHQRAGLLLVHDACIAGGGRRLPRTLGKWPRARPRQQRKQQFVGRKSRTKPFRTFRLPKFAAVGTASTAQTICALDFAQSRVTAGSSAIQITRGNQVALPTQHALKRLILDLYQCQVLYSLR